MFLDESKKERRLSIYPPLDKGQLKRGPGGKGRKRYERGYGCDGMWLHAKVNAQVALALFLISSRDLCCPLLFVVGCFAYGMWTRMCGH